MQRPVAAEAQRVTQAPLRPPMAAKIAALVEQGFLTRSGETLTATPAGRLLLNRVIEELLS